MGCARLHTLRPFPSLGARRESQHVRFAVLRSHTHTNRLSTTQGKIVRGLRVCCAASGGLPSTDIEAGFKLLDRGGYMFLDLRSAKAYDDAHITKPPRKSVNVPCPCSDFLSAVSGKFTSKAAKILVVCENGEDEAVAATKVLVDAGYKDVLRVEGGWNAWSKVFSTSGRRKPPPGKWVPTGKEALKSGLPVGDGSAAGSYEEGGTRDGVRLLP